MADITFVAPENLTELSQLTGTSVVLVDASGKALAQMPTETFAEKIKFDEIDAVPTSGSNKAVSSGGVKAALDDLETEVGKKQDTLTFDDAPTTGSTNPVKSSGVKAAITAEAIDRQNADGQLQQAIAAVMRPLWTTMGATYDAKSNTYTMNGLTGLTEENMVAAYQLYLTAIIGTGYTFNVSTIRTKIRTNFPLFDNASNANEVTKNARPDKRFDFQQTFRGLSKIEVIRLGRNITATTQPLILHENGLFSVNTFQACYQLKEITDALNVQFCARVYSFGGTNSNVSLPELRVLKLANVHMDVPLNFCPLLYYTSLKYLVDNAANTAAITVTVHADVYAKLTRTYEGSVMQKIQQEANETGQDTTTLAQSWANLSSVAAGKNISFAEP